MKKTLITGALLLAVSTNLSASDQALVISADAPALQWGPCPAFIPEGCEIAVLQGDPAQNNVDIYFKVPGDFSIPYHTHTSQERMVLVSGELEVTYDNHETAVINKGDFAYGPAKLPHKAYCRKGDDCILYIGFVAPLDAMPIEEKQH
ncbi:cupin domain [Thiogranum longum]|uniref:Cupin domain n=1 Tax=Thiogranum longum TaxID=1537524 RepID=A0A4R1HEF6_9GAMM|nr:cupin domain-containing protein [Thiogranum longum]TCK18560.1 cupin domain [Thiogranum longum]